MEIDLSSEEGIHLSMVQIEKRLLELLSKASVSYGGRKRQRKISREYRAWMSLVIALNDYK